MEKDINDNEENDKDIPLNIAYSKMLCDRNDMETLYLYDVSGIEKQDYKRKGYQWLDYGDYSKVFNEISVNERSNEDIKEITSDSFARIPPNYNPVVNLYKNVFISETSNEDVKEITPDSFARIPKKYNPVVNIKKAE